MTYEVNGVTVTDDNIDDIMTTALEGGINYWCEWVRPEGICGKTGSGTVEVVYLTTAPKKDLPTHVTIHSTGRDSTALCEQISTVSVERLGDYICDATEAEMMNIEIAMLISLDMDVGEVKEKVVEVVKEVPVETIREVKVDRSSEVESLREELARMRGKYEMMQEMYDSLLTRCLRAG